MMELAKKGNTIIFSWTGLGVGSHRLGCEKHIESFLPCPTWTFVPPHDRRCTPIRYRWRSIDTSRHSRRELSGSPRALVYLPPHSFLGTTWICAFVSLLRKQCSDTGVRHWEPTQRPKFLRRRVAATQRWKSTAESSRCIGIRWGVLLRQPTLVVRIVPSTSSSKLLQDHLRSIGGWTRWPIVQGSWHRRLFGNRSKENEKRLVYSWVDVDTKSKLCYRETHPHRFGHIYRSLKITNKRRIREMNEKEED